MKHKIKPDMTEIPEDVRERATAVAQRWYHEEWEPEAYIQQELVKAIALALLDERERTIRGCAAIAVKAWPWENLDRGAYKVGRSIERSILDLLGPML